MCWERDCIVLNGVGSPCPWLQPTGSQPKMCICPQHVDTSLSLVPDNVTTVRTALPVPGILRHPGDVSIQGQV